VQTIQTEAQNWSQTVQQEVENRAAQVQAIQPTTVAANPQEAVQQVTQYIDTVKTASLDQILSQGELSQIAQLGANATAGLNAQGIPQLAQFSAAINQVTQQLSRGDLAQAGQDLGNLQNNLLNSGLDLGQLGNLPGRDAVDGGPLGGERPGRP
jgi:hypothetical protein